MRELIGTDGPSTLPFRLVDKTTPMVGDSQTVDNVWKYTVDPGPPDM